MDIVIPYKEDIHKGLELKYALKSIEKHLTGYGKIHIIKEGDLPGRKEYSILQKILRACNNPEVSEDFIVWHDDHFLLKPLDVSEIKYWHNGTLEEMIPKAKGFYLKAIEDTINELYCLPHLNYDIHVPFLVNKGIFKMLMSDYEKEYCVKSLYINKLQTIIEPEYMEDLKINLPHYEGKLREKIEGRLFFSTGPYALNPEMKNLFTELYDS